MLKDISMTRVKFTHSVERYKYDEGQILPTVLKEIKIYAWVFKKHVHIFVHFSEKGNHKEIKIQTESEKNGDWGDAAVIVRLNICTNKIRQICESVGFVYIVYNSQWLLNFLSYVQEV